MNCISIPQDTATVAFDEINMDGFMLGSSICGTVKRIGMCVNPAMQNAVKKEVKIVGDQYAHADGF